MLTRPRSFDSQLPSGPWLRASQAKPRRSACSLSAVISHSPSARGEPAVAKVRMQQTRASHCDGVSMTITVYQGGSSWTQSQLAFNLVMAQREVWLLCPGWD